MHESEREAEREREREREKEEVIVLCPGYVVLGSGRPGAKKGSTLTNLI